MSDLHLKIKIERFRDELAELRPGVKANDARQEGGTDSVLSSGEIRGINWIPSRYARPKIAVL
jgi:hypothetical protein